MGSLIRILLLSLLFCSNAFGQILNIVSAPGYFAIPKEEIPGVVAKAQKYWSKANIVFRIKTIDLEKNPCAIYHNTLFETRELKCLSNNSKNMGISQRRKVLTYYVIDQWASVDKPVSEGGVQTTLIGGMALGICSRVAMGTATQFFLEDNTPALKYADEVLAHETFHMMCATHQPTKKKNIMGPELGELEEDEFLPVLPITKRQVQRWYAHNRNKK